MMSSEHYGTITKQIFRDILDGGWGTKGRGNNNKTKRRRALVDAMGRQKGDEILFAAIFLLVDNHKTLLKKETKKKQDIGTKGQGLPYGRRKE